MNENELRTEVIGCVKPEQKIEPLPPYWYFEKGVSDKLIDCLSDELQDIPLEKGRTFSSIIKGYKEDPNARDSEIMMFNPIHWFCGILFNYAIAANRQAEWGIEMTEPQSLQISHYGPGQHYTWHSDSNMFTKEKFVRKLSIVCLLSDKTEFEGGQFELAGIGQIEMNKGDVIVFPSMLQHRVVPVTSGFRKSSVVWTLGNRRW